MLGIWQSSKWVRRTVAIGCLVAVFAAQPYRPVVFLGHSMEPTYSDGSFAIGMRPTRELHRDDIVVINTPDGRIVKRIAFVNGDVMQQVQLGGGWTDNLSTRWVPASVHRIKTRSVPVPKGYIYVLGDNSTNSRDSRELGFLPEAWVSEVLVNPRQKEERLEIARKAASDFLVSMNGVPGNLSRKAASMQHL